MPPDGSEGRDCYAEENNEETNGKSKSVDRVNQNF